MDRGDYEWLELSMTRLEISMLFEMLWKEFRDSKKKKILS